MNQFTASNGAIIHRTSAGALALGNYMYLSPVQEVAWREFFQHERDEELGRWRLPENPEYVVYVRGDGVATAVNEASGRNWSAERGDTPNGSILSDAVQAYFAAHPERKPWQDAECGDYWYLEPFDIVYGCVGDRVHSGGLWFTRANVYGTVENVQLDDPRITGARKVWPEDAS